MKFKINPQIFEKFPKLKVGVIVLKNIDNGKRDSSVAALLRGICAKQQKNFKDQEIFEAPEIKVWADAYKSFGVNPKKKLPSLAALLKRVKDGDELPSVSLLVDLYNYFSLKYLLPIGAEDLNFLIGDLELDYTSGGESFRAIGADKVQIANEGEIAYLDEATITCRYWNFRDCDRTKVTKESQSVALIIEDLNDLPLEKFEKILEEITSDLGKYLGGEINFEILNSSKKFLDFGVDGSEISKAILTSEEKVAIRNAKVRKMEEKQAKLKKEKEENSGNSSCKNLEEKAEQKDEKNKEKSLGENENSKKSKKNKLPENRKNLDELLGDFTNLLNQDSLKNKIWIAAKGGLQKALIEFGYPDDYSPDYSKIQIDYSKPQFYHDYATNAPMQFAKDLSTNPRKLAEKILENLNSKLFEKVEIAGPGFINFTIKDSVLNEDLAKILKEKSDYPKLNLGLKEKTIIHEYSSPNIAKPLAAHHLLTTIIGQALYNINEKIGYNCISINHIGDWGTQFGKLITAYKKWGNKEEIEQDPINKLLELYIKFHKYSEENPDVLDIARNEFKIFEMGDEKNRELWQWIIDVSLQDVQKTYDRLGGIHFDYLQGESFYEDKMEEILTLGTKKGVIEEGNEGAKVINFEEENLPTVPIQKKDGATLYITRDLAALKYRLDHWQPYKILYVVDHAQSLHFQQMFTAAKNMGFYEGQAEHISFGRMKLKDQGMSTRKGTVIILNDLLDEGYKRALKLIKSKSSQLENKEEVAEKISVGAIKYGVLSQNRNSDLIFDWDKMLSFEGNSSTYLQYSYARARSILRKAAENPQKTEIENEQKTLIDESEKNHDLIHKVKRLFPKYSEVLVESASEYKPNLICNYLYELAQNFNAFYNQVPVLDSPEEEREHLLEIVEATAQLIHNGLELLGIEVIEEM